MAGELALGISSVLRFPMTVGEAKILFPIIGGNVVASRAEMITNGLADRRIWGRPNRRVDSAFTEEPVDRLGMHRAQELTFWISQRIFCGTCDVRWSRRYERQEHVLVEGQVVLAIDVVAKAVAVSPRRMCN